jgi:hypothetical protein
MLSGRGLDRQPGIEDGVIAERTAPHSQSHRQLAGLLTWQGQRATVEQIHDRRVAEQQAIGREEPLVALDQRRELGRHARHCRAEERVEAFERGFHLGDPRAPRRQQVDVVGGAHRLAAPDPQRDPWVVARFVGGEACAVPGPALGRRKAAGGVDARDLGEQRQRAPHHLCTGTAQRAQCHFEGRRDGRLERIQH